MKFNATTVHEIREILTGREAAAEEIVKAYISRIDKVDLNIGAFLAKNYDDSINRARDIDRRLERGDWIGSLAAVPGAVKDNICMKGLRTTCASRMLEDYISPYNASVIERLYSNDTVIMGKTNMDEFAMGSSNENSAFGIVKNPWDMSRVPGGSSGGSAAAVAAGEVVFALGSDTGGSVRQPASLCGVVGLKPTYGLVSRYGLIAFASSLDQIGIMTRDVEDMAVVLNCISGYDDRDSTTRSKNIPDYEDALDEDIRGMKIGILSQYFDSGVDEEVKKLVLEAADLMRLMGAEIVEVPLPHADYALAVYYILSSAEASSNLARYDGIRYGYRAHKYDDLMKIYTVSRTEGFGDEVKRRIMLGTYSLSSGYYEACYKKALMAKELIKGDFQKAFKKCDLLLSPTSPVTAFKIGERARKPLSMHLSDLCTVPVNIAGLCAISLPCGLSKGLPAGVQLIGNYFDEAKLLRMGYAYQRNTNWHKLIPAALGEVVYEL
jgi:aspartyl-tRNA(Asn)/glutamyl-tRNA(Gln) amidotransferase subunit A